MTIWWVVLLILHRKACYNHNINQKSRTWPLMEDDLQKRTFDGRQPFIEGDLWWEMTFDGRWPVMEDNLCWWDNLWWKMTIDGSWLLKEDNLWWKMIFNDRWHPMFRCREKQSSRTQDWSLTPKTKSCISIKRPYSLLVGLVSLNVILKLFMGYLALHIWELYKL